MCSFQHLFSKILHFEVFVLFFPWQALSFIVISVVRIPKLLGVGWKSPIIWDLKDGNNCIGRTCRRKGTIGKSKRQKRYGKNEVTSLCSITVTTSYCGLSVSWNWAAAWEHVDMWKKILAMIRLKDFVRKHTWCFIFPTACWDHFLKWFFFRAKQQRAQLIHPRSPLRNELVCTHQGWSSQIQWDAHWEDLSLQDEDWGMCSAAKIFNNW